MTKARSAIELDRIETHGYVEVLWSNGTRIRSTVFCNLDRARLQPQELAARRRKRRARKRARRRKGDRLKALLTQHGLAWQTLRYLRQP